MLKWFLQIFDVFCVQIQETHFLLPGAMTGDVWNLLVDDVLQNKLYQVGNWECSKDDDDYPYSQHTLTKFIFN